MRSSSASTAPLSRMAPSSAVITPRPMTAMSTAASTPRPGKSPDSLGTAPRALTSDRRRGPLLTLPGPWSDDRGSGGSHGLVGLFRNRLHRHHRPAPLRPQEAARDRTDRGPWHGRVPPGHGRAEAVDQHRAGARREPRAAGAADTPDRGSRGAGGDRPDPRRG